MNARQSRERSVGRGGRWLAGLLLMSVSLAVLAGNLALTKHNLTPSGPGPVKETARSGLCVFCHTPHHAQATRALWNRNLPGITYQLYQSPTMKAQPGQPTGASRLCLSCHDGVLALGSVRMPTPGSQFTLGPLTGPGSLGTNLSDDHPVSITYDSALAALQGQLVDPVTLPPAIHLDQNGQLQCTACHDPHEEINPDFLRMDDRYGNLCTACHQIPFWRGSIHATSTQTWTGAGTPPWPQPGFPTVGENACLSCHRPHGAGHPQWLMSQMDEPSNCTLCHDGTAAQKDVATEFLKPFHHPIESAQWTHRPDEDPVTMVRHVTCADCHNPHAATASPSAPGALTVGGSQQQVSGVSIAGAVVQAATYKYEICLKCHGLQEPSTPGILRQDATRNIRLRLDPANPSYHPVAAIGKNPTITGLDPKYTSASQIGCIDCHDNDTWTAGGTQPRGPHGSNFRYLLAQQYQADDPVVESYANYALCYKCHDRATLLNSTTGFPHNRHLVLDQASCAACHDAHGSRNNRALVDFMLRTRAGLPVVTPSSSGLLKFVPGATRGHGTCYLTCHGHDHNPSVY